jgi:putative sterol carrier protein
VVRYLSPEWISELHRAASSSASLKEATAEVGLVVQQEVTGGPDGDVAWHVVLDHGDVAVRPGPAEAPDVTFRQDHPTAVAINRGKLAAQAAFMVGRLQVGGDVAGLIRHQRALADIDDVFAAVRAGTEW